VTPAIEDALHLWVRSSTGLPAERVIWAHQKGPRPVGPYAMLQFTDLVTRGQDATTHKYVPGNANGSQIVYEHEGWRTLFVQLQFYDCPVVGANTAIALAGAAQLGLTSPKIRPLLNQAGLGNVGRGTVRNLTALLDDAFSGRAIVDARFACTITRLEYETWIETVKLTDVIS
jgi:hypothetical protein